MDKNPEKLAIEYLIRNGFKVEEVYNNSARQVVKIAIETLEKQIPKKPTENFYDEQDGEDWYDEGYTYYSCPSCEDDREIGRYSKASEQWIFEIYEYCPYCGQKIDTSSCT